jgi:dienelactone hydrolase
MASATACLRKPHSRRALIIAIAILLGLLTSYFWLDAYLDAASVLLRVSDSQRNDWLTRHDTNLIQIRDTQIQTPTSPVPARLYIPLGIQNPPAMVVLHGVHHLGIDEPRLVNFSRALATHGVLVLTPLLADLADYHVESSSIDVIGSASRDLKARTGADSVAVLGLSFAGGLALVTAADSRFENDIGVVISVATRVFLGSCASSPPIPSPVPMASSLTCKRTNTASS